MSANYNKYPFEDAANTLNLMLSELDGHHGRSRSDNDELTAARMVCDARVGLRSALRSVQASKDSEKDDRIPRAVATHAIQQGLDRIQVEWAMGCGAPGNDETHALIVELLTFIKLVLRTCDQLSEGALSPLGEV